MWPALTVRRLGRHEHPRVDGGGLALRQRPPPHRPRLRHSAFPSDLFSRYMRMAGNDVLMVSGTDEHGTPILGAGRQGRAHPAADGRQVHRVIAEDLRGLGLTYDLFTRTTTGNHCEVVQQMFLALTTTATSCRGRRRARSARPPAAPCRTATSRAPARSAGTTARAATSATTAATSSTPIDLINPKSRINGETPKFVDTEHLLPGPARVRREPGQVAGHQDRLAAQRAEVHAEPAGRHAAPADHARPRLGRAGPAGRLAGPAAEEVLRVVRRRDRLLLGQRRVGAPDRRPGRVAAVLERRPTPGSYYFMGKDNITFHAQIWPALLLGHNGAGDKGGEPGLYGELNLPTEIVSSEFLTMSGSKFSTSRGTVIYVGTSCASSARTALRYFIAAAGPETQDMDFTWDEFVRRINFELANEWGNLVNRSVSMAAQERRARSRRRQARRTADEDLKALARNAFDTVGGHLRRNRFKQASGEAMRVASAANKYMSDQEPWKLKDDPDAAGHGAAHRAAGGVRREHAAHAVPAALGAEGAPGAGRQGRVGGPAGAHRGRRPRRAPSAGNPVLTGDYAGEQALGVHADRGRAGRWRSRRRCSRSSTRSSARPGRTGRRSHEGTYGRQCMVPDAKRERPPVAGPLAGAGGRRAHPPGRLRCVTDARCAMRAVTGRPCRAAGVDEGGHGGRRPGGGPLGGARRPRGTSGCSPPWPCTRPGRARSATPRRPSWSAGGARPRGGRDRRDRTGLLLGLRAARRPSRRRSAGTSTWPSGWASR